MTSPLRKLLVVGALCWFAPLGAEPTASSGATSTDDESGCPYERARAQAEAARVQPVMIKAEAPLLDHRGAGAALLP